MLLLLLGVALPFVSAVTERRDAPRAAARSRPAPDLRPPASEPAPDQAVVPLATLPPIVPTELPPPTIAAAPPTPAGPLQPLAAPAPILMYHYVRTVDAGADPLGYELSVEPALFEEHLAWLANNGYTGIRLDLMLRCLRGEPVCPPRPVVITFDDGYADAYESALPALQRHGFTATFYIVSGFVGQPAYMSWDQLAQLRDAGMEIGAHTVDHQMLTRLDLPEMQRQIAQSRQDLEQTLGISVSSFCYPVGDYDATVVDQVRAAGYASAVTTRWDSNYADLLTLPRRRVAGGTTGEELGWIVTS
jgi:peptidoglycan/xylan/chitin deacetylase (PgdA/CDA1 family)